MRKFVLSTEYFQHEVSAIRGAGKVTMGGFSSGSHMAAMELRRALEFARDGLLLARDDDEARHWCRFIMGKLVSAGEFLAGTDSPPARDPSLAAAHRRALLWSESPTAHVGQVLPFLKTYGRSLVKELQRASGIAPTRWTRNPA